MQYSFEFKGEEYNLRSEISYYDAKRFMIVTEECKENKHKYPNEEILKVIVPAICPEMEIDFDDMSLNGNRLSFTDVLILAEDLSNKLNEIISNDLRNIDAISSGNNTSGTGKNGEEVIEAAT